MVKSHTLRHWSAWAVPVKSSQAAACVISFDHVCFTGTTGSNENGFHDVVWCKHLISSFVYTDTSCDLGLL